MYRYLAYAIWVVLIVSYTVKGIIMYRGFKIGQQVFWYESEIQRLQKENRALEVEIATKISLQEVYSIATQEGYIPITKNSELYIQ